MILQSYIVEKNIDSLNNYSSILVYGQNIGLKDDIKEKIKEKHKDAEIINFFQDEIIKKNEIVYSEINNTSLFNEKKIIILHEVSDKIFKIIEELIEKTGNSLKILVISGNLDKKSKIRNHYEKGNNIGIIPCYNDNLRTMSEYIKMNLKGYRGLTPEIINLIVENSGLNRKIINLEIKKVKHFFLDKNIKKEEVEELLNIKTNVGFEEIRDATLLGNKKKVNQLMGEIEFLPEDNFFFLAQMSTRVNKLLEIQNLNQECKDTEIAMENMKPKIFWKDKPIYIEQLKKWDIEQLKKVISAIGKAEIQMKKNPTVRNDLVIKDLLINICTNITNFS